MQVKTRQGLTLAEVLIASTVVLVIILGLTSIQLFSNFHVLSADRRAKIQNEAAIILEHISKNLLNAINQPDLSSPLTIGSDAANPMLLDAYVDSGAPDPGNPDLYASGDGQSGSPTDRTIRYAFSGTGPGGDYSIRYRRDPNSALQVIGENVVHFRPWLSAPPAPPDNCLNVELTTCWEPATATSITTGGTVDNPCTALQTSIKMPSVSTN